MDQLRLTVAGYGTVSAEFTTSWGEKFDLNNPNGGPLV